MISSQIYALFFVLVACFLGASSYRLFGTVPCPQNALRNCMIKVPSIAAASYCEDAVAAIECAVGVFRTCQVNQKLMDDLITYNPLGLQNQVDRICKIKSF